MSRSALVLFGIGIAGVFVLAGGLVGGFLNLPSILITFGGTIAAGCLAFPASKIADLLRRIGDVLGDKPGLATPQEIARLSAVYRVGGVRRLEDAERSIRSPFLKFGVGLVVDAYDRSVIEEWMSAEIGRTRARFESHQRILRTLVKLAPAFGLVGTIIGLVMMFRSLADPAQMGPAVSVALLTTLYGVLLANLLLLPIAAHLRERSEEDLFEMEAVLDGVLMIHEAVNPNLIARRLASGETAVPAAAGNGGQPRAESRHAGPAFDRGRVPARA